MLLDIFFPRSCLNCGLIGSYICLRCEGKCRYIAKPRCMVCNYSSKLGFIHEKCGDKSIENCLSIFEYSQAFKKIIRSIKYRGVYDAFSELFLMIDQPAMYKFYDFKKVIPEAVIQPIPLHPKRLAERGFNQSYRIAKFFSSLLNYPIIDLLYRHKQTAPQANISERSLRSKNIKGAFAVRYFNQVPSKVILVDDVVTTGYTVREAALALKRRGVASVYVFSLAKG